MSAIENVSDLVEDATAPPRRGVYAVWVLFAIHMVDYMDRQTLSLLVQPVTELLGLSDRQIGMISGVVFVRAFCLGGILPGRPIDQR